MRAIEDVARSVEEGLARLRVLMRSLGHVDPIDVMSLVRDPLLARLVAEELGTGLAVAYLGPEGTFSHEVAMATFGGGARYVPCSSIEEVVKLVYLGSATYGIVPIENSLAGVVGESVEALVRWGVHARLAVEYRITVCVVSEGDDIGEVREVYSHPATLEMARGFIRRLGVRTVAVQSTAEAIESVRGRRDRAALASRLGAELRGLRVLACGVEDRPSYTKFLVVSRRPSYTGDRTMAMFAVPNRPGSLYRALEPFASLGINLSMIYSKPNRESPWGYDFVLEAECQLVDEACARAFSWLESKTIYSRVLGSYRLIRMS